MFFHCKLVIFLSYHILRLQGKDQVAGTIVVETSLLVEFLGVEEVWGVPHTVSLLDEDLAVRDVDHVLGDLTVDVRDEGGGA